ncbi:hypothetical protein ACJMK2_040449 [Sinanodonta woodiana]|uniref:Zinc transporter ZIP3 n=1 Tax=Sinanodonta woodiana TaxID=1069815 RepID=A0ABD3W468_SINWO
MVSVAKLSGTFILFAISFLFGLLPYLIFKLVGKRLKHSENYKTFLSILNCFSGGVFFATTIMNLLPEALEIMEEVLNEAEKRGFNTQFKEYPITESLLGFGFFLILLIENIAAACCVQTFQSDKINETPCPKESNAVKMTVEIEKESQTSNGEIYNVNGKETNKGEILTISENETETEFIKTHDIPKESCRPDEILDERFAHHSFQKAAATSADLVCDHGNHIKEYGTITKDSKADTKEFLNNEEILAIDDSVTPFTKLRTLILFIALSLHMVFDGLALGLQKKDSQVWQLLGALAVHKSIVSCSVGLKLVETSSSTIVVFGFLTLFSAVSPLGMVLGIVITSADGIDNLSRDLASAILQGIATGTFMYVTFFEILFREVHESRDLRKALALIVGFVIIAAVKFIEYQ